MAETLILDAEAVHALARPKERLVLAQRARAILTVAYENRALVRVPANEPANADTVPTASSVWPPPSPSTPNVPATNPAP